MERGVQLVCDCCGHQYAPGDEIPHARRGYADSSQQDEREHRCLAHTRVVYDIERLKETVDSLAISGQDIWSYLPLLPVDGRAAISLGEGDTNCLTANRLGQQLGVDLRLKLEGQQPSGSTKDRGSAILATYAKEQGHDTIACASTGNAAASIAAYTARGGLDCSLFVPDSTPQTKAVQPEMYGAAVNRVAGSYADAYEACAKTVAENGWLDRSAGATPFTVAGTRTLGYELAAECPTADWIVVSMGNGGTLAGIWAGLRTAAQLDLIDTPPRMLGVQARGASTIHDRFHGNASKRTSEQSGVSTTENTLARTTCADSIAVHEPHRIEEACHALEESNGASVVISDNRILESVRKLGRSEGIFAEPASAAVIAGIDTAQKQGAIDPSETVVGVITGSGLKDAETARTALTQADNSK